MKIQEFDIGDTAICDACGDDYTQSDVQGGILFGSKAYCPNCTTEALPRIRHYGEERFIHARCPKDVTFADWVRALRDGDNRIIIVSSEKGKTNDNH